MNTHKNLRRAVARRILLAAWLAAGLGWALAPVTPTRAAPNTPSAPGQLESEIQANGWLHCAADPELIFDPEVDRKYNRALCKIGIDPWRLVNDSGHA